MNATINRYKKSRILVTLLVLANVLLTGCARNALISETTQTGVKFEFLGEVLISHDAIVDGYKFGGVSGLAYDADVYYAIGDDLENARFFTLKIDLSDGRLNDGDVTLESTVLFNDIDHKPFAPKSVDPEGIVLLPNRNIVIAAEAVGDKFPAFIREYDKTGRHLSAFHIDPLRYDPRFDEDRGSRSSGGFESLTLNGDFTKLYAAFEKPLKQDLAEYDLSKPTPVRILEFDLETREKTAEYVYMVGTMTIEPVPKNGWFGRGLNDLVWIDDDRFLSIERQYAQGSAAGERSRPVQIFEVTLATATNVADKDALDGSETPVTKTLVLDLDDVLDRVKRIGSHEVLLLGRKLPDGRDSLIMIEDNDFDRPTQVLVFAITR